MNIVDRAEKAWADNAIEIKKMETKLRKLTGSSQLPEHDLLVASIRSFWVIQWIRNKYNEENEQNQTRKTGLASAKSNHEGKKGRGRTAVASSVDASVL